MANQPFDKDEKEFLKAVGLNPNNLEKLVESAPPVSADVQARIRERARSKAGIAKVAQASRRTYFPRWAAAAAALVVAVSGAALITGNQTAQAALERLLHLVPGMGIKATEGETLVLAEPVKVQGAQGELTVIAVISGAEGTEVRFRIDGLVTNAEKSQGFYNDGYQQAELVLPDGERLMSTSAAAGGGIDNVHGTFWFPALPAGVSQLTLQIDPIHQMTEPFSALLSLVDVETAGLTRAVRGGWSQENRGITLGAPHVAFNRDMIALSLMGTLSRHDNEIEFLGARDTLPTLVDDLGNSYPLDIDESSLHYNTVRGLEAIFTGPVQEGATSLRLTVPAMQVLENGEAQLKLPLADLPVGKTVDVNQTLQVGERSFAVLSVTRLAEDRFGLDLDLGPSDGGEVLQYLSVRPGPNTFVGGGYGSSFQMDPNGNNQAQALEVNFTPKGRNLDLRFSRAVVLIEGPWEIELPLR